MDKDLLRKVILDQQFEKTPEPLIEREKEIVIEGAKRTKDIVIVSGIRRCGKSTLIQRIRSQSTDRDYFINFDDERLIDFTVRDFQNLIEIFLELFGEQNTFYFDEIQNIPSWERFVRRLHNEGKKVYITGSNASMLSRELGTHLTGRYVEKHLYPFSFKEFLQHAKVAYDRNFHWDTRERVAIRRAFYAYVKWGGFPEYVQDHTVDRLQALYESIIYRDIVVRYNIPNEKPLKELAHICTSNIGKEVSFHGLAKMIGLKNSTSVKEYFSYCENSFLFFLVSRFHYSLKKQKYAPKKVYCVDTALAEHIGFRNSSDKGRFLENVVFLHLKRSGKEIYYHRRKYECDFIVRKNQKVVAAVQVAWDISNPETKKREIEGLFEAMDMYGLSMGTIVTLDKEDEEILGKRKIVIVPITKWLLQ